MVRMVPLKEEAAREEARRLYELAEKEQQRTKERLEREEIERFK